MQSKFHIGQKVICNRSNVRPSPYIEIIPIKGNVYTVRGHAVSGGLIGIYLEEIINAPAKYEDSFGEMAFAEDKFSPIENIKVEWSELASKELVNN